MYELAKVFVPEKLEGLPDVYESDHSVSACSVSSNSSSTLLRVIEIIRKKYLTEKSDVL